MSIPLSPFRYPPPPTAPRGTRQTPPLVGLQLFANDLQPSLPDDRYDPNIMHRVVSPTLQNIIVSISASSCDLAATFSLPVAYVASNWLTSTTPMELPGYHRSVIHPPSPIPKRRRPVSPTELASYRQLAVTLTRKLEALAQPTQPNQPTIRPSRARIEELHAQALAAIPETATSSTSTVSNSSAQPKSLDPPFQPIFRQPATKERCGFSASHTHQDLLISADHKTVSKKSKGLYRCARTASPLNRGWNYYIEFLILKNAGEGGVCVGLTCVEAPLNHLVGTSNCSIGFHSSGKLVVANGEWLSYGNAYNQGDTIGMLVEMPPQKASQVSSVESLSAPSNNNESNTNKTGMKTPSSNTPRITFFVNGTSQGTLPLQYRTFLTDDKHRALLLHPTACLYRAESSIGIRCCATEWEYFPSASAVCSGLSATCRRRNCRVVRGSSMSSCSDERRKFGSRELGGCDSVLTP